MELNRYSKTITQDPTLPASQESRSHAVHSFVSKVPSFCSRPSATGLVATSPGRITPGDARTDTEFMHTPVRKARSEDQRTMTPNSRNHILCSDSELQLYADSSAFDLESDAELSYGSAWPSLGFATGDLQEGVLAAHSSADGFARDDIALLKTVSLRSRFVNRHLA